jgi:hypothetical protein
MHVFGGFVGGNVADYTIKYQLSAHTPHMHVHYLPGRKLVARSTQDRLRLFFKMKADTSGKKV